MAGSALLGEPPATHDDALIYKALEIYNGSGYFPLPASSLVTDRPPDDYNGNPLVAALGVLMTLVILFTAARVWAQRYRKKRHIWFWVSHIFLFFSAMTTLAYDSVVLYIYAQLCGGRHVNYCTYEDIAKVCELLVVAQSIFYFAVYCAKLSIISFLRGAVEHAIGWWNLSNTIFFGLVVFLGLWSLLSTICSCNHVPAYFSLIVFATTDLEDMHCLPEMKLQLVNRGLHIATDLCLFMFPVFLAWRVQLSWKRKILFILPFTLGLLTVAASITRNVEMSDIFTDVTWTIAKISIWDFIDINFSAMLMSMPFIMPLIDRALWWYRQRSEKLEPGGPRNSYVEVELQTSELSSISNNNNNKQPQKGRDRTADEISFHEFMIDAVHGNGTQAESVYDDEELQRNPGTYDRALGSA